MLVCEQPPCVQLASVEVQFMSLGLCFSMLRRRYVAGSGILLLLQMMGKFTKEQALLVDLAAEASQLLQRQRAMCAWAPPALAAPSAEGIAAGPANGAGPC